VTPLDERHRLAQRLLSAQVDRALAGLVDQLDTLSEAELAAYHDAAYPIVAGGQRQAATYGAGYGLELTRQPGVQPTALELAGALQRSGVMVTPESRSLVAPVLRTRRLVNEGATLGEAKQQAATYAAELASGDLNAAQRVGIDEGAAAGGADVAGYRKETGGDACDWCRGVADDRLYSSADSVPFHAHDRCSVSVVLDRDRPPAAGDADIPF